MNTTDQVNSLVEVVAGLRARLRECQRCGRRSVSTGDMTCRTNGGEEKCSEDVRGGDTGRSERNGVEWEEVWSNESGRNRDEVEGEGEGGRAVRCSERGMEGRREKEGYEAGRLDVSLKVVQELNDNIARLFGYLLPG